MNTDAIVQMVVDRMQLPYGNKSALLLQFLIELQQHNQAIGAQDIQRLQVLGGVTRMQIQQLIDFYSFLHVGEKVDYRLYVSDNIVDRYQGSDSRMHKRASSGVTYRRSPILQPSAQQLRPLGLRSN